MICNTWEIQIYSAQCSLAARTITARYFRLLVFWFLLAKLTSKKLFIRNKGKNNYQQFNTYIVFSERLYASWYGVTQQIISTSLILKKIQHKYKIEVVLIFMPAQYCWNIPQILHHWLITCKNFLINGIINKQTKDWGMYITLLNEHILPETHSTSLNNVYDVFCRPPVVFMFLFRFALRLISGKFFLQNHYLKSADGESLEKALALDNR